MQNCPKYSKRKNLEIMKVIVKTRNDRKSRQKLLTFSKRGLFLGLTFFGYLPKNSRKIDQV